MLLNTKWQRDYTMIRGGWWLLLVIDDNSRMHFTYKLQNVCGIRKRRKDLFLPYLRFTSYS